MRHVGNFLSYGLVRVWKFALSFFLCVTAANANVADLSLSPVSGVQDNDPVNNFTLEPVSFEEQISEQATSKLIDYEFNQQNYKEIAHKFAARYIEKSLPLNKETSLSENMLDAIELAKAGYNPISKEGLTEGYRQGFFSDDVIYLSSVLGLYRSRKDLSDIALGFEVSDPKKFRAHARKPEGKAFLIEALEHALSVEIKKKTINTNDVKVVWEYVRKRADDWEYSRYIYEYGNELVDSEFEGIGNQAVSINIARALVLWGEETGNLDILKRKCNLDLKRSFDLVSRDQLTTKLADLLTKEGLKLAGSKKTNSELVFQLFSVDIDDILDILNAPNPSHKDIGVKKRLGTL